MKKNLSTLAKDAYEEGRRLDANLPQQTPFDNIAAFMDAGRRYIVH